MEQSKLNLILDQHKLWIETKGKQGKCANLTYANLYGADLRRANLSSAKFSDADLSSAKFSDADLTGADLNGANLRGTNLHGADLTDANLQGANLTGASLWGASLVGADLNGASLTDANLQGANLTGASLTDANLEGANLGGADLSNAILPDISWIIPGCLAQLNNIMDELYLEKENKLVNFVQDSFGFIIQNNGAEGTFDMLLGDRIIRNIPHWVKYSGLKQIASESV